MINVVDELMAVCGALVGGARYGLKVHLSSKQKLRSVLKLAFEHASNLAFFATIYKSILVALKWSSRRLRTVKEGKNMGKLLLKYIIDGPCFTNVPTSVAGRPERAYHSLVAGSIGGYFVWGQYSSVNHQIVLYLASRVFIGLSKRTWEKLSPGTYSSVLQHPRTYSVLSAALWGIVMVLFEESPHVLHRSLKQSMDEIYRYQVSSVSDGSATDGDEGSAL
eukprot:scaffold15472_cov117-Cylindrotheca_fusiformis.AAC.10